MRRATLSLVGVCLAVAMIACTSPEARRARGGGPGADPGNRGQVVRIHEGSQPYYETPRLIRVAGSPLAPANQPTATERRSQ